MCHTGLLWIYYYYLVIWNDVANLFTVEFVAVWLSSKSVTFVTKPEGWKSTAFIVH